MTVSRRDVLSKLAVVGVATGLSQLSLTNGAAAVDA